MYGDHISDANLQEYENMESMPRPEEDREIEIEKNKRLQQQLKVNYTASCQAKSLKVADGILWLFLNILM